MMRLQTAILPAALAAATAVTACGGRSGAETAPDSAAAVTVSPDNLAVVDTVLLRSGPGISGDLRAERQATLRAELAASVLSGNRNFEGRIHPAVRANFLASPPLVIAYALAGSILKDLTRDPLGEDRSGKPVYLRDIWPDAQEIRDIIDTTLSPALSERLGSHLGLLNRLADLLERDERFEVLGNDLAAVEAHVEHCTPA